jgi:short-subunit dehydrogenase
MTNDTALITGASSGMGAAFARQLAAQGYDLILVARRQERLAALVDELQQRHSIRAEALAADLSDPGEVSRVEQCIAGTTRLTMLVNNAGFGSTGHFVRVDLAHQLAMIQLHVITSVRLCRAALPGMLALNRGGIINVSSTSAFAPMPGSATYSGTKAFLVNFSEALQQEVAGKGIKVQALCPGFVYTEFHDSPAYAGFKRSRLPGFLWMSADEVVADSLKALGRGVVRVPGRRYRLAMLLVNRTTLPLLFKLFRKKIRATMPGESST